MAALVALLLGGVALAVVQVKRVSQASGDHRAVARRPPGTPAHALASAMADDENARFRYATPEIREPGRC